MGSRELERRVEAARRFNRFYTRQIGLLRRGAYNSPFSLTEVRVLYELAHLDKPTASDLGRDLGLDAGYLSRMLRGFERRALVTRARSAADGRRSHLALTALGRRVFAPLDARSHDEVAALLSGLTPAAQTHVIAAMRTIERLLGRVSAPPPAARRPGLGGPPPRRGVRARVRLRRAVRGPGRRDRGAVRRALRPGTGALLDRRAGRRRGGVGVPGRAIAQRGAAAPASGRAAGARVGPRHAPGGRVCALCPAGGVPHAHALDPERALRRPAAVPGGGLWHRPQGAQPQLREGARVGDLAARPDGATVRSGTATAPNAGPGIAPESGYAPAPPRPRGAGSPLRCCTPGHRAATPS